MFHDFYKDIFSILTIDSQFDAKFNLVKKHKDKFSVSGDFSFVTDIQVWRKYLPVPLGKYNDILEYAGAGDGQAGLEKIRAAPLRFPIERILVEKNRCLLFLQRCATFQMMIPLVLDADYGKMAKKKLVKLGGDQVAEDLEARSISQHRISVIRSVLTRLVAYSRFELTTAVGDGDDLAFFVTNKSSNKACGAQHRKIICGAVTDPKNGNKLAEITAAEYIKKRSNDMQLMAMHKYGVRVKNDAALIKLIEHLGRAAVTVDLLEVKHSSPVAMNTNGSSSSSKGAAFILYNSARLETLFRKLEEKIESGYFPKLPDLADTDLTLLDTEEEWELFFNHVMEFPNLVTSCVGDLDQGKVSPHLVCNFLCVLVGTFSVYYRRVRILTENRVHLLPTMYARFQFLKCLRLVLNKTLSLLDIDPIDHM